MCDAHDLKSRSAPRGLNETGCTDRLAKLIGANQSVIIIFRIRNLHLHLPKSLKYSPLPSPPPFALYSTLLAPAPFFVKTLQQAQERVCHTSNGYKQTTVQCAHVQSQFVTETLSEGVQTKYSSSLSNESRNFKNYEERTLAEGSIR